MTLPVIARMIASALREPEHRLVYFIWHGGETTGLPISFYEKAMLVHSQYRQPNQLVRNTIQTNGTLLTPSWVRLLRYNESKVGVSLDGPSEMHEPYRRYASGRTSFDDVARRIGLLKDYGVPFTLLMVIDKGALELRPDRIFDFFLALEIKHYSLIAAKPTNQTDAPPGTSATHYSNPIMMTAFLSRLYDRWQENGDPRIRIPKRRTSGHWMQCAAV